MLAMAGPLRKFVPAAMQPLFFHAMCLHPDGGADLHICAALMIALLVGQIIEQTGAPYTWFPWVIVGWVALVGAGALWLAATRPRALELAGAVLGTGDAEEPAPAPAVASS